MSGCSTTPNVNDTGTSGGGIGSLGSLALSPGQNCNVSV